MDSSLDRCFLSFACIFYLQIYVSNWCQYSRSVTISKSNLNELQSIQFWSGFGNSMHYMIQLLQFTFVLFVFFENIQRETWPFIWYLSKCIHVSRDFDYTLNCKNIHNHTQVVNHNFQCIRIIRWNDHHHRLCIHLSNGIFSKWS